MKVLHVPIYHVTIGHFVMMVVREPQTHVQTATAQMFQTFHAQMQARNVLMLIIAKMHLVLTHLKVILDHGNARIVVHAQTIVAPMSECVMMTLHRKVAMIISVSTK
ncbi:MAG TPA: hypothetical protein PLC49_06875 [Caldisericia bacterium]|nr:hypothetical protein [Caldisericia bacterium]